MGDQRCSVARAHTEQNFAAGDQQLVAELELLRQVWLPVSLARIHGDRMNRVASADENGLPSTPQPAPARTCTTGASWSEAVARRLALHGAVDREACERPSRLLPQAGEAERRPPHERGERRRGLLPRGARGGRRVDRTATARIRIVRDGGRRGAPSSSPGAVPHDRSLPKVLTESTGRPHRRARRNRRHSEPEGSSTTWSARPTSADASRVPRRMTRSASVPAFMSRPFLGRRVASIRPARLKVYCTLVLVEGARTAQARRGRPRCCPGARNRGSGRGRRP